MPPEKVQVTFTQLFIYSRLGTGRWTYNDLMPILPIVGVGVWPVLQMSLLPALALYLTVPREALFKG